MSRCRFVQPDFVRLSLSDGDFLDVKKELTAGEQRRVFTDLVKTMHAGEKAELDPAQVGKSKILAYVVGWSLLDPKGSPVPFSESALDNVDPETFTEIATAIDAHETAMDQARVTRKNDLGGASNMSAISRSVD